MSDPLFPPLPENLADASDEEIAKLLEDHNSAADLIDSDDAEFLKGLSADEVIEQYAAGVEAIKTLRAEHAERLKAHENFVAKREELKALRAESDDDSDDSGDDESGSEEEGAEAEVTAEAEAITAEAAEEPALVTASSATSSNAEATFVTASVAKPRLSRTPPAPSPERIAVSTVEASGAALVASSQYKAQNPEPLDADSFAHLMHSAAEDIGPSAKDGKGVVRQIVKPWRIEQYSDGRRVEHGGGEIVWDGPKTKVARADFDFPGDRTLTGGDDDFDKIRAALPPTVSVLGKQGTMGQEAITASGGICAPSTPFYSMVNFGTEAEPVWDSLPVFRAARGGVNVPESTYIADITTAISTISEDEDAQGGTFATKSCQALECPDYTETFVSIFAHCREYGNLNARTWPEKIAHENAITMQALARTSEDFMLEQIKALSINVTNGAETLGALIYLVDAIVKAKFGIAGRLRMPANARFRALLPSYALDLLLLDTIQTQFDRFRSKDELNAYLRSAGIDPVYYIDGNFAAGDDQLPDAAQAAGALDGLPNTVQWAIYPDGAFLGIDSGSLELGIVRDSQLNSTNDFQVFGERFRNLVRIAPAQAALWVTTDWCPSGQFPPAGTARTCE